MDPSWYVAAGGGLTVAALAWWSHARERRLREAMSTGFDMLRQAIEGMSAANAEAIVRRRTEADRHQREATARGQAAHLPPVDCAEDERESVGLEPNPATLPTGRAPHPIVRLVEVPRRGEPRRPRLGDDDPPPRSGSR